MTAREKGPRSEQEQQQLLSSYSKWKNSKGLRDKSSDLENPRSNRGQNNHDESSSDDSRSSHDRTGRDPLAGIKLPGEVERLDDHPRRRKTYYLDLDQQTLSGKLSLIDGAIAARSKLSNGLFEHKAVHISNPLGQNRYTFHAHVKESLELRDSESNAVVAALNENFSLQIFVGDGKKIHTRVSPEILRHPRAFPCHFLHLLDVREDGTMRELVRLSGRNAEFDGDYDPIMLFSYVCACYEMYRHRQKHHKVIKPRFEADTATFAEVRLAKFDFFDVDTK